MSNIQLKGNNPSDPWYVVEGSAQEIAEQLMAVFPTLTATDPTQFPSLVAQARELWAAQVAVGQIGGQEVAVERQAPPQQQAWGGQRQQAQPQQYQPAGAAQPGPAPLDQFGKPMVWKTGTSKAGKPYKGWFGDYQRGDARGDQVPPQWVR